MCVDQSTIIKTVQQTSPLSFNMEITSSGGRQHYVAIFSVIAGTENPKNTSEFKWHILVIFVIVDKPNLQLMTTEITEIIEILNKII